jgi:hypothetical protein
MKKLNLLYAIAIIALAISCGKDDEDPKYKKEDFVGTWERTSVTPADDDCPTSTETLVIDQTKITITAGCDGSEVTVPADYTFDNKATLNLTLFGVSGKLVIKELSSTNMTVDMYAGSQKQGTSKYKKK